MQRKYMVFTLALLLIFVQVAGSALAEKTKLVWTAKVGATGPKIGVMDQMGKRV